MNNLNNVKRVLGCGSTQIKLMLDGTLRYRYEVTHRVCPATEVSLLVGVADAYRPAFDKIIKAFNLVIAPKSRDLPEAPWHADTVVSIDEWEAQPLHLSMARELQPDPFRKAK